MIDFQDPQPITPQEHQRATKPLTGKRVVITRAAHQSGELADLLQQRGAEPVLYPCIAIAPPEDTAALDTALEAVVRGNFDWLVLTSANTVLRLAEHLEVSTFQRPSFAGLQVAAVGAATAEAAEKLLGVTVNVLPEAFRADALARAIDPAVGARILLPQADVAPLDLAESLTQRGAQVTTVTAYRTVVGSGGADIPALLAHGEIDAITFASPSAVSNFIWRLVEEGGTTQALGGTTIACIGPTTLKKAIECGLSAPIVPAQSTLEQLVQRLEDHFSC
jgi:uroporphyrinogen-III synthase